MATLKLRSREGEIFEVSFEAIKQSEVLWGILDISDGSGEIVPLDKVRSGIMEIVLRFIEHHKDDELDSDDDAYKQVKHREKEIDNMTSWDKRFIDSLSLPEILETMSAANYLIIKKLTAATSKKVARMLMEQTTSNINPEFAFHICRPWPEDLIVRSSDGKNGAAATSTDAGQESGSSDLDAEERTPTPDSGDESLESGIKAISFAP